MKSKLNEFNDANTEYQANMQKDLKDADLELLIYLDSFDKSVSVPSEWIELLKSLLLGVYIAYFGSRGLEKYKTISK